MMLLRNPIIWLRRIAKRKGYGIHSPFAFDFVTDVLYNKEQYYAYRSIDESLGRWQPRRVRDLHRLAFRLANYRSPRTLYCPRLAPTLVEACIKGHKGVEVLSSGMPPHPADMIFLDRPDEYATDMVGEGTMVVLCDLPAHSAFWRQICAHERISVTFDLYYLGIAFARSDLNREHYIINW